MKLPRMQRNNNPDVKSIENNPHFRNNEVKPNSERKETTIYKNIRGGNTTIIYCENMQIRNHNGNDDVLLKANKITSISFFSAICVFVNSLIGIGFMKNSRHSDSGVVFTTIVNFAIALLFYYSTWMILFIMNIYKTTQLEACWKCSQFKGSFIISIVICITCLGFAANYFKYINLLYQRIVYKLVENPPKLVTDNYFFDILLIFVFLFPSLLCRGKRYLVIYTYIKLLLVLALFILMIYWLTISIKKNGFDPDGKIQYFTFEHNFQDMLFEYIGSYVSFCYIFLAINNMYDLTYNRAKKVIFFGYFIFAFINELSIILQYFTLFDKRGDDLFLFDLDQDDTSTIVGSIAFILLLVFSFPTSVDPMRISSLMIIESTEKIPQAIWSSIGFIWLFASALDSTLASNYVYICNTAFGLFSMLIQLIFPPIMLIKAIISKPNGTIIHKAHWIGVAFFLLAGLAATVLISIELFGAIKELL